MKDPVVERSALRWEQRVISAAPCSPMGVQTRSAGSSQTHQHPAHVVRKGLIVKQPDLELLPMVADEEMPLAHICQAAPTSNSGFIFIAFLKRDRNFPWPPSCLISGKAWQHGSLKGESQAVVITSLFRKPLLNLSDVHGRFDATSGEISDDTPAVSNEGAAAAASSPSLQKPLIYLI